MKSSDPSIDKRPTTNIEQPIAASGGVTLPPSTAGDPLAALDDLMVVVEGLCPRWPARGTFKEHSLFRL
jgi:hypothetical protein